MLTAAAAAAAAAVAAAAAEAARRVRRRPCPFRSAARRTPCSSPATRRRVAARYRSSYRPRYGRCARCRRAGCQSRLRSRTARSRRAMCRSFSTHASVRRFRPLQTWPRAGGVRERVRRCRQATAATPRRRHGRRCCARQIRPRASSGKARRCWPSNGSGGWPRWQRSEHGSSSGRRSDARRRAGRRTGSPPPRRLTRPVATSSKGSSSGCRSAGQRAPLQPSALQRGRSSRVANCWRSMRRRCWASSMPRRRAEARHPARGRHRRHLWIVGNRL